jgi:hypothetical protein
MPDEFIDITRLSEPRRKDVLKSLARGAKPSAESARQHERFDYHVANVQLSVQHEAGGEAKFLVHARNLSCGGMAFLHGGFLHAGAKCRVTLKELSGTPKIVLGRVAGCRHVSGNVHEVRVQFHEKVDVQQFCAPQSKTTAPAAVSSAIPRLSGLALLLSSVDAQRAQLSAWLSGTGLNVVDAPTLGAAIDRVKRLPLLFAVCDADGAEWNPAESVKAIRDAGFTGPVVIVSTKSLAVPGAQQTIQRPIGEAAFFRSLLALRLHSAADDSAPIYSTLAHEPETARALPNFVEQASTMAMKLDAAAETLDRAVITEICHFLKRTAGGYGYGILVQSASAALDAASPGRDTAPLAPAVRLVASLCRRLTAKPPPAKAA